MISPRVLWVASSARLHGLEMGPSATFCVVSLAATSSKSSKAAVAEFSSLRLRDDVSVGLKTRTNVQRHGVNAADTATCGKLQELLTNEKSARKLRTQWGFALLSFECFLN